MVRAFLLGPAVLAVISWLSFGHQCSAQQLPSVRTSVPGSDVTASLYAEAVIFITSLQTTGTNDYDALSDEFEVYVEAFCTKTYGSATATTDVSAYAAVSPGIATYTPWASAFAQSDNSTSGEGGVFGKYSNWQGTSQAYPTFTVAEHPYYSAAGQDPNSATLHAYLWFSINGEISGAGGYNLGLYAEVGDSDVFLDQLDQAGENWSATGTLSCSTSANPSASPIELDDTVIQGFHEWQGTQATNVDDAIPLGADIGINYSFVYPGTGYDVFSYFAEGLYTVMVP